MWLICAGRMFGKTRAGAEWLAHQALTYPETTWGVIAPTKDKARTICLEGESGLLDVLKLAIFSKEYNRTTGEITLPNRSVIHRFGAEAPASVVGKNLHGAWADEVGNWHYKEAWDRGLMFALRKSPPGVNELKPHIVVTTTPDYIAIMKPIINRRNTVTVFGSSRENEVNVSPGRVQELEEQYGGTRLARVQIEGELLEDVPGALWTTDLIDSTRLASVKPALFNDDE